MKNKKILYIDMDGVVADFYGFVDPKIVAANLLPSNRDTAINYICSQWPRVFRDLEPIKDSQKYVYKLATIFNVYFLSTPMWELPESWTDKRLWIMKHFGRIGHKKLILTHRKDLCIGDYLIDDRLVNGASEFKGKHIHFGHGEFKTWEDIYTYLKING